MVKVEFPALVKSFNSKALVSLDKSYRVELIGENPDMIKLAFAPADKPVKVTIEWESATDES